MKGIFLLIANRALGKKILYFDTEAEWADHKTILKDFQCRVTMLNSDKQAESDDSGLKYGMSKAFFREMFLPAASTFQNDMNEVTIE